MTAHDDFFVGFPRCNEPRRILLETLDAIDASTCRPARLIVIDNGDEPLDDELRSRIRVQGRSDLVRPPRNIGCAGAWNAIHGIAGDFTYEPRVIILNADCAVAPDTFEKMLEAPARCSAGDSSRSTPRTIRASHLASLGSRRDRAIRV